MNIHVRNLAPETSLSELLVCFEVFGKVTDATISTYKVDGIRKGLGNIEMPSCEHAQAAIKGLQGKEFAGSWMQLREE